MVGWWLADFHIWFGTWWVIKVSVSSKRLRIEQNEWNESTGGRFMMFLFPLISLQWQIHEYVWIQTYLKNSQPWPNHPFIFISLLFAYTSFFNGWVMVGSFSNWIESVSLGLGNGWQFFKWDSILLYYFINGWVMVGRFSNWIESVSSRVGWWLAVFQMEFNALLLH